MNSKNKIGKTKENAFKPDKGPKNIDINIPKTRSDPVIEIPDDICTILLSSKRLWNSFKPKIKNKLITISVAIILHQRAPIIREINTLPVSVLSKILFIYIFYKETR